jgi:hypothetical protein
MNPFVLQPDPHRRRRLVVRLAALAGAGVALLSALVLGAALVHSYDTTPAAARAAATDPTGTERSPGGVPAVAVPAPAPAAAPATWATQCSDGCSESAEAVPHVLEPLVIRGTVRSPRGVHRAGSGRAARAAAVAPRSVPASRPARAAKRELSDAELQKLLDGE